MQYSVQLCLLSSLAGFFLLPAQAEDNGVSVPAPFQYDDMKPSIGEFSPFLGRSLAKRQTGTCATSNSYECPNGKCCPIGYQCDGDGVKSWCCPNGQVCDGADLFCPVGFTDCTPIIGEDGCCPTATHKCAKVNGVAGCAKLTGNTCDTGYFACAGGDGCCPTGTTCVAGTAQCLKPCDPGYSQCGSVCCDPSSACVSGTCVKKSSSSSSPPRTTTSNTRPTSTFVQPLTTTTPGTTRTTVVEPEPGPADATDTPDSGTPSSTTRRSNPTAPPSPGSDASTLQAQWLGAAGIVLLYLLMF